MEIYYASTAFIVMTSEKPPYRKSTEAK